VDFVASAWVSVAHGSDACTTPCVALSIRRRPVRPFGRTIEREPRVNYLCLIFADEQRAGLLTAVDRAAVASGARAWEARLRHAGRLLAFDTLAPGRDAVAVLHPARADLEPAGAPPPAHRLTAFALLDARDLNDAIRLIARLPLAQLGSVEVRAVEAGRPR
jgi:hypothetical protein